MPLIQMTMIEGRTPEKKKQLIRELTDTVERVIGSPRQSIRVILQEVPASHWGVGGEPRG